MTTPAAEHVDVVIVGAGLSGVGAAYRLQTGRPGTSYVIVEARASLGGTWDLFRYPGVRSDSDMYTLGYAFKPWTDGKTLADGPAILDYIRQTAEEFGIADRIRYDSSVVAADFDTGTGRWTLTVANGRTGERRELTCGFLYSCAGYYDYDRPYNPGIAGADTFAGPVVHPQFWPADLDYAGRRVAVVGSGASAVTLVPALLEGPQAAAHVTMVQRSPTWVVAVPSVDRQAERIKAALPEGLAHRVVRAKNIVFGIAFFAFCQRRPAWARRLLTGTAARILGDAQTVTEHFTPTYNPWDQRLCAAPSGDLFRAVRSGRATMVTSRIDRISPTGIVLETGAEVEADIIVTATGLNLRAFGGIQPQVDGQPVRLSEQFIWAGAMVTGVPNFAACFGYTNASWTLRADLTHRLVVKVLSWMERRGHAAVVPRPEPGLTPRPMLDLTSSYIRRSIDAFPHQGGHAPWRVRQNYVLDSWSTLTLNLSRTLLPVPTRLD